MMDEKLRKALPPEYLLLYESVAQGLRENPKMGTTIALGLFTDLLVVKALNRDLQVRCDVLEWQRNRLLAYVEGSDDINEVLGS